MGKTTDKLQKNLYKWDFNFQCIVYHNRNVKKIIILKYQFNLQALINNKNIKYADLQTITAQNCFPYTMILYH